MARSLVHGHTTHVHTKTGTKVKYVCAHTVRKSKR